MIRTIVAALLAGSGVLAPTVACAAEQLISFEGVLDYGSVWGTSPFGTPGTQLGGKTYKIVMTYDPTLFENTGTCGSVPSNQCNFTFTSARPLTGTFTVDGVTNAYSWTSGEFYLSAGGNDQFGFNFNGPSGSFSGSFGDTNSFYPNQTSVNAPIFASFTNLAVTGGQFQFNRDGFGFGDQPSALTTSYLASSTPVPELSTWVMMMVGFGFIGFGMRRRQQRAMRINFA